MRTLVKCITILFVVLTCTTVYSQQFTPVSEIPEGKALVYIYRPGSMVGALIHYSVNANDKKVSEFHLRNNTYLVFIAEPDTYRFWARVADSKREVNLVVEPGKTYYVRGNCCDFTIPELEKATKEIVRCKLSKS